MKIEPIKIETVPAKDAVTKEIKTLSMPFLTSDNPQTKILRVMLNGFTHVNIVGDEYATLGQWTDDSLTEFIFKKYGFEESK